MRVFISVDLEGVAGVVDEAHWKMSGQLYDTARDLMVKETNAAVEGALEAGATEIVVNDSHHRMINLDAEKMHPAAELIIGRIKPMSMCQGMGPGFDAAVFVGYHGGRGTGQAVLDHTYTGLIHDVTINGRRVNEALINGLVAGHFGFPLVLVTGDQALAEEMSAWDPAIRSCVVKESQGRQAVKGIHPTKAREKIRSATKSALEARREVDPLRVDSPITLEIELQSTQMGDVLERVVGIERLDGRRVRVVGGDMLTVFRHFLTIITVAGTVYT
jgi:D-amino peptidase